MILKDNHLTWKSFYVLQTFQKINQLSKTTKWRKICFCSDEVIEAELFKFKNWHQTFTWKSNFCIYVIICCCCIEEYTGQSRGKLKNRLSINREDIRQPKYEKIEVERHLRICAKEIFKIFPFFKMKENNKILRKCSKIISLKSLNRS